MTERDFAQTERVRFEAKHGLQDVWPPTLPPPNVTIETMLEWHERGCVWPVGGDETTISISKGYR